MFKKGICSGCNNYRPISLICVLCKVMERLIATGVLFYWRNNNLITKHQHGFLSSHSTCTQLIETVNVSSITFKIRFSVDSDFLDFVKALDTVSHHKLIFKLESYEINGHLLVWIKTFLSNRLQSAKVGNCLSRLINVISEVSPMKRIAAHIIYHVHKWYFWLFYGRLCNCYALCRRWKTSF